MLLKNYFIIAFVIILTIGCNNTPKVDLAKELDKLVATIPATTGKSATISFDDVANRTSFSTEGQVWEQNGIKVTNNKGASTSNVADYSNPVRFYKNSDVVIEHAEKIAKIVITTKGESKYQIQEGDTFEGATLSVNGTVATIVLNEAANSYTFTCSGRQLRIATIEIYFAE